MNGHRATIVLLILATSVGSLGCGDPGGGGGATQDSGTDSDTDADADTDADLDTDTLVYDGGPYTQCEGSWIEGQICVKGGRYLMGCMPYDPDCEPEEHPTVEVTLSPFWIDRKEATYESVLEWLNSLGEGYLRTSSGAIKLSDPPGFLFHSNYYDGAPIILNEDGEYEWNYSPEEDECHGRDPEAAAGGLSWLGAKLYCESRGMRLPTEAEWEAAARGHTRLIWPCAWYHLPCWYGKYAACIEGDECYDPHCEECCIPFDDYYAGECDSPFGVRAMYGNAAEWVLDWQGGEGTDHSRCAAGCTDPPPAMGDIPIFKGGSIVGDYKETRISSRTRQYNTPEMGDKWTGVRCVRSPVSFDGPDGGL